eukprot:COSAG01_NODE_6285_length_3753_cov_7.145047_8_plen_209_part_00
MIAQTDGLSGTIEDLTVSANTKILSKAVRDMSDLTGVNSAELLGNDLVVDLTTSPIQTASLDPVTHGSLARSLSKISWARKVSLKGGTISWLAQEPYSNSSAWHALARSSRSRVRSDEDHYEKQEQYAADCFDVMSGAPVRARECAHKYISPPPSISPATCAIATPLHLSVGSLVQRAFRSHHIHAHPCMRISRRVACTRLAGAQQAA